MRDLKVNEIKEVSGGNLGVAITAVLTAIAVVDFISDFKKGWDSVEDTPTTGTK